MAICAVSDALLIIAGVGFLGALLPTLPGLSEIMRWVGAAFLAVYGALRFRAAWRGGKGLLPHGEDIQSVYRVAATCLALTWANPHGNGGGKLDHGSGGIGPLRAE